MFDKIKLWLKKKEWRKRNVHNETSIVNAFNFAQVSATASPGCRRRWTIWRRRGWRPSAAMSRRWPGSFTRGCPPSPASPCTATSPHGTGRRWCL